MDVLSISKKEIEELASIEEIIDAVEKAFKSRGEGRVQMPPKSYIFFEKYNGDFRSMPAYLEEMDAAGVKVVNVHPDNPEKNKIPSVMATITLLDPETGAPIAIMDGTSITRMRTSAASAVATKYMAGRLDEPKTIAMIGAGVQARTQLLALEKVVEIERVLVEDIIYEKADEYAEELGEKLGLNIVPVKSTEEVVSPADIVVTVTPRKSPIVMSDWISPGTHINAIGADAPEKQELDPEILKRGKIVVDDWKQASHSGEISIPISQGKLDRSDLHSELSGIITGDKPGRKSEEEITIFDSTGLAIQDIASAYTLFQKANDEGIGTSLDLL